MSVLLFFLDRPESEPSPRSDELQSDLGEEPTLGALHIQVFDKGCHLAVFTDRDMVGDMDQQITAGTAPFGARTGVWLARVTSVSN